MEKIVFCAMKALIVNEKDECLLLQQRVGDKLIYDLPGGRIKYGEEPISTLLREIKEEIGVDAEIIQPLGCWHFFRISDKNQVVAFTYKCKLKKDAPIDFSNNPDEIEQIEKFIWVNKDDFASDKIIVEVNTLDKLLREYYNI